MKKNRHHNSIHSQMWGNELAQPTAPSSWHICTLLLKSNANTKQKYSTQRIKKHRINVSHSPQLEVTHSLKHGIYLGISKLFTIITIFFPKYMSKYYFPNYWPLLLVTCNFSPPVQVRAVTRNDMFHVRVREFAHETHGLEGATAPGLLQKHNVRVAAQTKGAEIKGRGRETKSWGCYSPGTVQKRWVSHSGPRQTNFHFLPPPQKQVLWVIHHLAHGYSLCRTCCLNKGQLFGICEKCGQAP